MNKEGKFLSSESVDQCNKSRKTLITKVLIGGAILGTFLYSYWRCRNSRKKVNEVISEHSDGLNSVDDDKQLEIDYEDGGQILKELIHKIVEDPIFGANDVIVVKDDSDDVELDEIYQNYTLVEYMESSENFDGYVGVTFKLNDTLYAERRNDPIIDPMHNRLRDLIQELKDSKYSYSKLSFSSKALGFYFETEDGKLGENLRYTELRQLESISGFRYIEFRFFHCESDNGLNFVKEVLKLFHPEGGEEGNTFDIMPIIISVNENGIKQYEGNNIVRKYLKL